MLESFLHTRTYTFPASFERNRWPPPPTAKTGLTSPNEPGASLLHTLGHRKRELMLSPTRTPYAKSRCCLFSHRGYALGSLPTSVLLPPQAKRLEGTTITSDPFLHFTLPVRALVDGYFSGAGKESLKSQQKKRQKIGRGDRR